MSPVTQYVYDGKGWRNEVVGVSRTAAATTTSTYPLSYGAIGSYRPSATTSGVPAGLTLRRFPASGSADYVVTTPGTVLDRLDIHGRVIVKAADVTIQRCVIRGVRATTSSACVVATAPSCVRLLVQDCELVPEYPTYWMDGIDGHDFTCRRCEIRDTVDYFGLWNTNAPGLPLRVVIEQNWGHNLVYFSPTPTHSDNQTHNDGIQFQGGTGAVVRGNSLEAYYGPNGTAQPTNVGPTPVSYKSTIACLMFNNNVGKTGSHIIEDNWLMGGYIPVNCGAATGANLGRLWRNRFSGDSLLTSGIPQTILLRADQTCDTGSGTSNQNVYDKTGLAVTVKRNG